MYFLIVKITDYMHIAENTIENITEIAYSYDYETNGSTIAKEVISLQDNIKADLPEIDEHTELLKARENLEL